MSPCLQMKWYQRLNVGDVVFFNVSHVSNILIFGDMGDFQFPMSPICSHWYN